MESSAFRVPHRAFRVRWNEMRALYGKAFMRLWEDDAFGLASEMAYNGLFSIFPSLLVLGAIVHRFGTADLVGTLMQIAERYLPAQMADLVERNLRQLLNRPLPGTLTFGSLALLWLASNFMNVVLKALRRAYRVQEPQSPRSLVAAFLVRRLLALGLVVFYGIATAISFNFFVFGFRTARLIESALLIGDSLSSVVAVLRWPLAFVSMTFSTMLLYTLVPTKGVRLRTVWLGALTFSVLWLLATGLFSAYVAYFADYNRLYGAIAGIIMLMSWFYLSSLLLFFGAEVNAVRLAMREHRTSANRAEGRP